MRNLLFLLLLFVCSFSVAAQGTPTEEEEEAKDDLEYYSTANDREKEESSFSGQLWYGAGAQLGFSSNQFTSFFQIGLSPIVGYKINNFLSVGPRGGIAYNAYRIENGSPDRTKVNFWTWQAGLFARAKIYQPFFAHVEYSLVSDVVRFDANDDPINETRAIPFLGGGISQGGPGAAGYEIMILFRLSQADRIGDSPFDIRTGLNFNF